MQQIQQLISFFSFACLTSLAPLIIYALISTFEQTLSSENHEAPLNFILLKIKSVILRGYSSLFSFSLMMIALNIIYKAAWAVVPKKSGSFEDLRTPSTISQKKNRMKGKRTQTLFFLVLFYGVFYFSLRSLPLFAHDSPQVHSTPKTTHPFTDILTARALEQIQEESFALTEYNQPPNSSDLKTLSIGKALSFLNINPAAILLSKTGKLAYIITRFYGTLKVVDISDLQYPTIIGTLDLTSIDLQYQFKTLKLSADEKTLFASSFQWLEIIDVTKPQSPSLISFFKDSAAPIENVPFYFIPTLAFSQDETILYVAGIGLKIFNITKTSHPEPLVSVKSPLVKKRFTVTSLALLPDGNTLAYTNNALEFYDVSDPSKPRLLSSYSGNMTISSLVLSQKDAQIIYAAGFHLEFNEYIMLEKINISNRLAPQSIHLYWVGMTSQFGSSVMAISPNETNIFVSRIYQPRGSTYYYMDMVGYDFLKEQRMVQSKSLLQDTTAIAVVPNTNHVIVGSRDRFEVIEFSRDYPNTKAFCIFESANRTLQLPPAKYLELYSDNIWFTLSREGVLKGFNITNDLSPQQITSYEIPRFVYADKVSLTKDKAFLRASCDVRVLDISSNITEIGVLYSKDTCSIVDFQISKKKNIGFLLTKKEKDEYENKKNSDPNPVKLSFINFTDFVSITETSFAEVTTEYVFPAIFQPKNADLLFFMLNKLHIYNVSDPTAPTLITSQSLGSNEGTGSIRILSFTFSQDTKILFALMYGKGGSYTLSTFDISNLTDFQLIHALTLPKIFDSPGKQPFILSNDMKKGFVITDENLLVLDLRNLTSPTILGAIPLGLESKEDVQNFFLSSDEKVGYIHTTSSRVLKINLELTFTLYLPQEKFLLGKKYSDPVMLLSSDREDFILTSPADYKIIRLSLFNRQVHPSQNTPLTTYTALPSWMAFDSENQILTMEPKRQRDIDSYTLYSMSSKKVLLEAFRSLLSNSSATEDLLTSLISLGYLDNQRFLTPSFGPLEDFLLPSQYAGIKGKIYQILWSHRIETWTDFNILPSLELSTESTTPRKFAIKTTSFNTAKVDIRLFDTQAQFLQKQYANVLLLIAENKNRLIIEGSLDQINKALQGLVININRTGLATCQGEITINDNLNPPISQFYENISDYFFHNDIPKLNTSHNSSVQEQIDAVILYTGQYFSINLDPYTFQDQHSDSLTYVLVAKEDDSLPSWLSFQGLTLKGTPPEEIFHREFRFGLIIQNEFKQIEVPVALNVKISWLFIGKLLLRFSPYILTAIGLLVSANKIYNILLKKRYRHAREFGVRAGEEINSSIIFPIRFIAEEKVEGDLILKHLENKAFLSNGETEIKAFIKEAINKMSVKDRQRLKLYSRESSQRRVNQYILNEMIMWQLNLSEEKATKEVFDRIKDKWVDLIDYDINYGFTVNEKSLNILLGSKQKDDLSETVNGSLLHNDAVNIDLLKKALIVHAAKNHELDYLHSELDILVHEQKPKSGLFKFFKQDLERVKYSDKGISVYGLSFNIKQNTLEITGTLDHSFEGKTLAIQIVTRHQRIVKEIWIHGVSNLADYGERLSYMDESQAIGKEYEAF